jgi:aldehyde dehydrogenase (NAD+)
MKELVNLQRGYFNSNATKPITFRLAQLSKPKGIIKSNEGALQQAIHQDIGKGTFETFLTEFFFVNEELKTAIAQLQDWAQPKPTETNLLNVLRSITGV